MKIIDNFYEIPSDVAADIVDEYNTVYDEVVREIEAECEAEGYPSRGSNFELRLDNYDDYFDSLWISLIANHGYIYRSQDDNI